HPLRGQVAESTHISAETRNKSEFRFRAELHPNTEEDALLSQSRSTGRRGGARISGVNRQVVVPRQSGVVCVCVYKCVIVCACVCVCVCVVCVCVCVCSVCVCMFLFSSAL